MALQAWLVLMAVLPIASASDFDILMVGNSYTQGNATGARSVAVDLQGMFDTAAHHSAAVSVSAVGGYSLQNHLQDANTTELITTPSHAWDIIVLQEQSLIPGLGMKYGDAELMALDSGGPGLIDLILQQPHLQSTQIILFQTWARHPDLEPAGNDDLATYFDNEPHQMQAYSNQGYERILASQPTGRTRIARVGNAWENWYANYGDATSSALLHTSDGSHQNPRGSYLSAALLFETITGESAVGNAYQGAISGAIGGASTSELLQQVATATAAGGFEATPLVAGQVVIIGAHSGGTSTEVGATGDEISWAPLVDLRPGQTLFFSDVGHYASSGLYGNTDNSAEGIVKFVVPYGGLSAGEVQTFGRPLSPTPRGYSSAYSIYANGALNLSASGDQVLVFQDEEALTAAGIHSLYALNLASSGWSGMTTNGDGNQSSLYPGLVEGVTAVAVGSGPGNQDEFDNARYTGITTGTRAALLAAIGNASNWEKTNFPQAEGWTSNGLDRFTIFPDNGDFNNDTKVDAADYTVWRDRLGFVGSGIVGDADGDGIVDAADWSIWRNSFDSIQSGGSEWAFTVPEPAGLRAALSIILTFAYVRHLPHVTQ